MDPSGLFRVFSLQCKIPGWRAAVQFSQALFLALSQARSPFASARVIAKNQSCWMTRWMERCLIKLVRGLPRGRAFATSPHRSPRRGRHWPKLGQVNAPPRSTFPGDIRRPPRRDPAIASVTIVDIGLSLTMTLLALTSSRRATSRRDCPARTTRTMRSCKSCE